MGALLVMVSITSLGASRNQQFMVFVRVLPLCRLAVPSGNFSGRGMLGINCTRNTGYSVSLVRSLSSQVGAYTVSGVGSGVSQTIPLNLQAGAAADAQSKNDTPLFLTINY